MEEHWQEKLKKICCRSTYLYRTNILTDCSFLVGKCAQNRKLFRCHKLILAMASSVFELIFYGHMPSNDEPLIIPDVQPCSFEALLLYIYTERINIKSFNMGCELCVLAHQYMIPHLIEMCISYLSAKLNWVNACQCYEFGQLFNQPALTEQSMQLIKTYAGEVLAHPNFTDIKISTIIDIFSQEYLNIVSELDLFNGLVRFVTVRRPLGKNAPNSTKQTSPQSTSDGELKSQVEEIQKETSPQNQKHVKFAAESEIAVPGGNEPHSYCTVVPESEPQLSILDDKMLKMALKKIRFLTMTPKEFAEGPAVSNLLSDEEVATILINISSSSVKDCPMPKGFSTSRCKRKPIKNIEFLNKFQYSKIVSKLKKNKSLY